MLLRDSVPVYVDQTHAEARWLIRLSGWDFHKKQYNREGKVRAVYYLNLADSAQDMTAIKGVDSFKEGNRANETD